MSDDNTESLADLLGGFGMIEGEAGEEFAEAVHEGRKEMNADMECRAQELNLCND